MKVELVRSLGAAPVIDCTREDFADRRVLYDGRRRIQVRRNQSFRNPRDRDRALCVESTSVLVEPLAFS